MIKMKFSLPEDVEPTDTVQCDRCDYKCMVWEADYLKKPDNLCIGDEIPAGACPNCNSGYVYLLGDAA